MAPTGAGKTIMLSAVTGAIIGDSDAKACVLAHRDELTTQNRAKFARVNPLLTTSVVDAETKSWCGQVTFAMVPTLARTPNLAAMPRLDLLVIDEAHHAVADSYRRIIDPQGAATLRTALQGYLWRARGISCTPDQIVIVNGSQQGLDLCARLLLDPAILL